MKIGFGLVGCGMIAAFHARAINDIRGAGVVAVYTSRPETAEDCRHRGRVCDLFGL